MSRSEFSGQEISSFGIGTLLGTRSFGVDRLGRLHGIHHTSIWRSGENLAVCGNSTDKPHKNMDYHVQRCVCGFYAYAEGSDTYASKSTISGVIEASGGITVGTHGFRAEKAKIVALTLPSFKPSILEKPYKRLSKGAIGFVGMLSFLAAALGIVTSIVSLFLAGLSSFLLVSVPVAAVGVLSCLFSMYAEDAQETPTGDTWPSVTLRDRIIRNYPDVKVFETRKAMLKAFPVKMPEPIEVSPDEPDFWTRKV